MVGENGGCELLVEGLGVGGGFGGGVELESLLVLEVWFVAFDEAGEVRAWRGRGTAGVGVVGPGGLGEVGQDLVGLPRRGPGHLAHGYLCRCSVGRENK